MKNHLQILSLLLVLGLFAPNSVWAQCVELGTPVGELTPQLKAVGGVCGPAAVATNVCDCPAGFVAVGYIGLEGNQWGAQVLSQFSLRCRELNTDGSLGTVVTVTCSNGTDVGNTTDGPVDAAAGQALVGFEVRIGCAIDAVTGASKPIADIAAGTSNATNNNMALIGGPGGSAQPIALVPDGSVIVGMQSYEDPSTNISGGVAWRYAPIVDCTTTDCNITSITLVNASACDDGGTDDVATDDTYTADITVNFSNPPASGTLNIAGGLGSIAVGALVGNSHTFTGVTLPANGLNLILTASFSADPTCSLTSFVGVAPANCSPNAPDSGIPTLSEWGLIIFALIIFSLVVVFGFEQKRSLASANTAATVSAPNQSRLPFDKKVYLGVLPLVYLAIAIVFVLAIVITGYELTGADLPGSLVAGAIVAYLVHFVKLTSGRSKS